MVGKPEVAYRTFAGGVMAECSICINTGMRHTRDLTDEQWKTLDPLIPKPEPSNPRSISIEKRNCRCCLQRIRERMLLRCSEPDSLNTDRIAVFPAKCGCQPRFK